METFSSDWTNLDNVRVQSKTHPLALYAKRGKSGETIHWNELWYASKIELTGFLLHGQHYAEPACCERNWPSGGSGKLQGSFEEFDYGLKCAESRLVELKNQDWR